MARLATLPAGQIGEYLRFAARYVPVESIARVVAFSRDKFKGNRQFQGELIEFIRQGLEERGVAIPASVRNWALDLAKGYLETVAAGIPREISWEYIPHPAAPRQENPWHFSTRRSFARQATAPPPAGSSVLSSFPTGEQKVGTYRSENFVLPEKFGFWIAGHDKRPDEPLGGKNFVRLRDALSHTVIRQVPPPRNDKLHYIGWDTSGEAGRRVYLELVDGNTDGAFAWMAVGGFSVAGLNPSRVSGNVGKGAALARSWGLSELKPLLASLVKNKASGYKLRGTVALQLAGLHADARLSALALVPGLSFASDISKEQALGLIATGVAGKAGKVLESVMKAASAGGQRRLAEGLAADRAGVEVLLSMVETGKAGAALLRDPAIAQKLSAASDEAQKKTISKLLEGLAPRNEQLNAILEKRKQGYIEAPGRLGPGRELFKKTCAPCHRVGNEGRDFAPNLDGVGNRGLDRLIEDILDPNRNVDVAFRSTTIVTRKGQVITGLLRPGTGQRLVLVDREGREISIPAAEVARKQPSRLSPMPANLSETLSKQDLRDLLTYLLSLRSA